MGTANAARLLAFCVPVAIRAQGPLSTPPLPPGECTSTPRVDASNVYQADEADAEVANANLVLNCYWLDRSKVSSCAAYGHLADNGQYNGKLIMCMDNPKNQKRCQTNSAQSYQCVGVPPSPLTQMPSPPPPPPETCDDVSSSRWCEKKKYNCHRRWNKQNCALTCGECGAPSAPPPNQMPSPSPSAAACQDIGSWCAKKKGKCRRPWFQTHCAKTCGTCVADSPPPTPASPHAESADLAKCHSSPHQPPRTAVVVGWAALHTQRGGAEPPNPI